MDLEVSRTNVVSTREKHYVTANVGRDTIENVEYIVFDRSSSIGIDLTLWDKITLPFSRMRYKVKEAYWEIRYGFQRMFKGYDSVDTFETFAKFIERYSKVIKELRNNHMGYPYNLSEEEWDNVLDDMLYHLYYMDEWHVIKELEKNVPEELAPSQKSVDEIMDKHKDAFFKLFSEYFYSLWD